MNAPAPKIEASTKPEFLWPVLGSKEWGFGPIAYFDDYYKAVDFVNASLGIRNLFIGEPLGRDEQPC